MPSLVTQGTTRALVMGIVLIGAVLRLYGLGKTSFDSEEITQIGFADGSWPVTSQQSASARHQTTPLSAVVTRLALHWGYAEATVRLPSALGGIATLVAVAMLGPQLVGGEAALYATALLACSPLHVTASRHVGSDPWFSLLAIISVAAFCWSVQEPRNIARWMIFSAVTSLAALSGHAAYLLLASLVVSAVLVFLRHGTTIGIAGRALLTLLPASIVAVWWISGRYLPVSLAPFPMGVGWLFVYAVAALATGADAFGWGAVLLLCAALGAMFGGEAVARRTLASLVVVGVSGVIGAAILLHFQFDGAQVGFVLPAYLLLAGSGLSVMRQAAFGRFSPRVALAVQCAALAIFGLIEWKPVRGELQRSTTAWREAARIVAANALPGQPIVVLPDRTSFVFYAPDLDRRVEATGHPAFAPGYFVGVDRGWLIAPAALHLYPGWDQLANWLKRFPPVNLSPDPSIDVLYLGRGEYALLFIEAAFFDVPTAALVRGNLLFRLLQVFGPIPHVLWKVDQIALSREQLNVRNPDLLNALYYLAEHGHADRAASLAYRLAVAEPNWAEAQRALAAFHPTSGTPAASASGKF